MRITAAQARERINTAKSATQQQMQSECDATLNYIYGLIDQRSGAGYDHIKFEWNGAQEAKKGITIALPTMHHEVWSWDGGEGRGDKPSWSGDYIKKALATDGYKVELYMGHLKVSW